jgi:hypothetical protein
MIDPSSEYPGKITAPDANYDYGSAKSATTPTAQDGTPWSIKLVNDFLGFPQKLLKLTGIIPSGNSETQLVSQYYQALCELMGRKDFGEDAVNTNNYVVTTLNEAPVLKKGHRILLLATNASTGASDINPDGLGVTNIKLLDGSDTISGSIPALQLVELVFDGTNFILMESIRDHDHGSSGEGGDLGDVQANKILLATAAPATPDANTLYKDLPCKAWIEMDGTGTPSITNDVNVSSIVDLGVGNYRIVFARAFANINYIPTGIAGPNVSTISHDSTARTVTQYEFLVLDSAGGAIDKSILTLAFFGEQ